MMSTKKKYLFSIAFIFCLGAVHLHAQSVSNTTDRSQILIGEKIVYELSITLPVANYKAEFSLPAQINHFETLESNGFDTTQSGASLMLRKKIIFTSFDSGSWYFPSLPVTIRNNKASLNYFTDSVLVNVGYAAIDSSNAPRDIRSIIEVEVIDYFWWYVAGIILLVLIISLLIYRYRKNRPVKINSEFQNALSPYDEAMNDLKILSNLQKNSPVNLKEYHTRLSAIFKKYYGRRKKLNLLNTTSDELLLALQSAGTHTNLTSDIAEALRTGDAVKFAQYAPSKEQSEKCFIIISESINTIEKNYADKNDI